jgi:hypothetical protein
MKKINSDKIIDYCVKNPDETVENIAKKFKITNDTAFYLVKVASKKLK